MMQKIKAWAGIAAVYLFCLFMLVMLVFGILADMGFRWGTS